MNWSIILIVRCTYMHTFDTDVLSDFVRFPPTQYAHFTCKSWNKFKQQLKNVHHIIISYSIEHASDANTHVHPQHAFSQFTQFVYFITGNGNDVYMHLRNRHSLTYNHTKRDRLPDSTVTAYSLLNQTINWMVWPVNLHSVCSVLIIYSLLLVRYFYGFTFCFFTHLL